MLRRERGPWGSLGLIFEREGLPIEKLSYAGHVRRAGARIDSKSSRVFFFGWLVSHRGLSWLFGTIWLFLKKKITQWIKKD
jgi:hypothetical protein